jgi:hypothetical protein
MARYSDSVDPLAALPALQDLLPERDQRKLARDTSHLTHF